MSLQLPYIEHWMLGKSARFIVLNITTRTTCHALVVLVFSHNGSVCVSLQEANLQLQCERWRHLQWRFLNCKLEDAMVAAKPKVCTRRCVVRVEFLEGRHEEAGERPRGAVKGVCSRAEGGWDEGSEDPEWLACKP